MLERNDPWCDPPCESGETCDFSGECIPWPEAQDLGEVTVAGLAAAVAMEPVTPGYAYFDTSIPHQAFEPDVLVELETDGGRWDPVALHAVGVEELVVHQEMLLMEEDQPLVLTWDPPEGLGRSEVELVVSIDQHGTSPVSLECTFADDGEGQVPASLTELLVRAGVSGFPSGSVSRRTADSTSLEDEGCMDLVLASARYPDVRVDGYIPCRRDEDCPPGQTCNLEIELCE